MQDTGFAHVSGNRAGLDHLKARVPLTMTQPFINAAGNRNAIVTGTGGLGLEVAMALAKSGIGIVLAGRNRAKGEAAAALIRKVAPGSPACFALLDLASLASIRQFAADMEGALPAIDILVNNAGIMSPPQRRTTADGFELQFGVNYLGHFALTAALLQLLRRSPSPRVVNVTSLAHRYAKLDFADLQSVGAYQPGLAYCRSKLAQALFARELQRRSAGGNWGVASMAAHPGFARTNLFNSAERPKSWLGSILPWLTGITLGQSAQAGTLPVIHAATSPLASGGELYGPRGLFEMRGKPGLCAFSANARDQAIASQLWQMSEDLLDVRFPAQAPNA